MSRMLGGRGDPVESNHLEDNLRAIRRKKKSLDHLSLRKKVANLDTAMPLTDFDELPLSEATMRGLSSLHYKTLTEIQAKVLPHALKGKDILGAAKTGSGKTLTFLVPVLEALYEEQWTELDGLGALILSPTRELALQIFEVLRKVGRYHNFSAGLVIGGKKIQDERGRLGRINILVCTPGRVLQHMDETATLQTGSLRVLVIDEADRIMDMGFQSTIDAILEHLPKARQTLLFSATQTQKVSDLARLSLNSPEYIAVGDAAMSVTPTALRHYYTVTPLPEKVDALWSFIRNNLKSKTLIFLSSSKQVRFVYEAFRRLRPGVSLLHLHGRQKLGSRIEVTRRFSCSLHSVLFATDVAARGLDFPAVDWVIQADCPENVDTYIHRVGRTARYERSGRAVLFLVPTEEKAMIQRLMTKNIPVEKINVRPKKKQSIATQLQNMCFKDSSLKYLAQKAFVSYVKSVHIQKDKDVFDIKLLPLDEFAAAMGLPGAPKIRFIKGEDIKAVKNRPRGLAKVLANEEEDTLAVRQNCETAKEERTKFDRIFERRNQDVFSEYYHKLVDDEEGETPEDQSIKRAACDGGEFLAVKRRFCAGDAALGNVSLGGDRLRGVSGNVKAEARADVNSDAVTFVVDSKRREKLIQSRKRLLKYTSKGNKVVFDDEGNARKSYELESEEDFHAKSDIDVQRARFLELEGERQRLADIRDKEIAKQKRRERKEKRKALLRDEREAMLSGDEGESDENKIGMMPAQSGNGTHRKVRGCLRGYKLAEHRDAAEPARKRQRLSKLAEQPVAEPNSETLADLEVLASGFLP
ncbi:ATP-dependent RNA helicase dbp4 [Ascosphaera atra]|nr:ATP-dependent RNA helicase dbp4 [Ascosphaera atra]